MAWVKAASLGGEDVFDENADDLSLQSKEWMSNMKKRVKDGYVEGVDAGEEASLQAGFDEGFREGVALTAAVGRLRGILSAICCWWQTQHPETPVPASVTDLLQQVNQHEDQIMKSIKTALENPPPSVSDVSESMEDLEVESGSCAEGGCKESDCCKNAEKVDLDSARQHRSVRSSSSNRSSNSGEGLNQLVQRCIAVVQELGLPQDLIAHLEEFKNL